MARRPNEPPIVCRYFTWVLRVRNGVFYADHRGKHKLGRHSLGTRDRDTAMENLRQLDLQKAIEQGLAQPSNQVAPNAATIEEGWNQFLDYCGRSGVMGGVSASSKQRYEAVRDKHVVFCGKQGILTWEALDKRAVERYGNSLSRSHADRTAYFELTLLKSVNRWLIANGYLAASAVLQYPLRKPQGSSTYCPSVGEVTAMVQRCAGDPELMWLGDVILAMACTGLRISELCELRWSDVNLERNMIRIADERASGAKHRGALIRTTKGRRSRVVPIHPRLRLLLVRMKRNPDGRVFHASRGGPLRSRNVLHAFKRDVIEPLTKRFPTPEDERGFRHTTLRSFRHFFCSQAFLSGASEGEIRDWLGHSDSRITELYRHLRNEDAQRKMRKIDFLNDDEDGAAGAAVSA